MSNGESKIVIFKAALCYGFAIALRALFLGILCSLIATLVLAMTQEHVIAANNVRARQSTRHRIAPRLIATRLKPLAMTDDD